ncbi:hypothetical protein ACFE04_020650 [Oxalis oulophora]
MRKKKAISGKFVQKLCMKSIKNSKSGRGTSEPIESIFEKESISKRKSILEKKRKRIANESISKKKSIAKEESISNLPILPDYFVDADDLKENGVHIGDYVSFFGLEKVLSCKEEICYGELVNEFYGFSVENVSSSKVIDGFKAEEFCSEILVQGLSKVAATDLKILPRIWYTILWKILMPAAGSHYKLKTTELQILWHVMKRRPVNFGKLMIVVMRRPIQRGENTGKKMEKLKKVPNLPYVHSLVKRGFDTLDPHHYPESVVQGILPWLRKLDSAVRIQEIRLADVNQNSVEMAELVDGEGVSNVSTLQGQADVYQNLVDMASVEGEGVTNVSTLQVQADVNQNLVDMASVEGEGVTNVSALQGQADGNQNAVDMAEGATDVSALQVQEPSDDATNFEEFKISCGNKRDIIKETDKLLVLDINGVLGEVQRTKGGLIFYKRPYADDFLELCFIKFCSCHLDFSENAQEQSLKKGYRFDMKGKNVDAFFKPLKEIWDEYPKYDKSNTLLVDDSPYKAFMNPENTAIFPIPYKHGEKDDKLGDLGEIRVYLKELLQTNDV